MRGLFFSYDLAIRTMGPKPLEGIARGVFRFEEEKDPC